MEERTFLIVIFSSSLSMQFSFDHKVEIEGKKNLKLKSSRWKTSNIESAIRLILSKHM